MKIHRILIGISVLVVVNATALFGWILALVDK